MNQFRKIYGNISGMGFANANIIGSFFIDLTISFETTFGADTPMKTSASFSRSAKDP
jgi:hypothetical protein